MSTTYEELLATRALMGISEAFYIPAALALIADFHRGATRSRAVGLHQMGIYCRRHRRRLRRLRGRPSRPRLALGLRRLRHRRHRLRACRSSCCCGTSGARSRGADDRRGRDRHRPGRAARSASCSATARSSCWCSTSRCPRWRLGRARLDAGDSEGGVRHRPGPRRRVGDALLAGRGDRRRGGRRLARRSLDATEPARPDLHERARHGAHRAGDVRRGLRARDRPAVGGRRLPDHVRPRLGVLRLQQHADPLPDRAAVAARHRLWHHEPGQHQLRRLRRLGLRPAARPARAAVRHLRHLRQRRGALRRCSCC